MSILEYKHNYAHTHLYNNRRIKVMALIKNKKFTGGLEKRKGREK